MTSPYLPADQATIQESCLWLEAKTGEQWTLPRMLDWGMQPYFWLDYSPGWPDCIFGDKTEGYLAPMVFMGDTNRLSAARSALVTMTRTHDGTLMRVGPPGLSISIDDLRFLEKDITRLAEDFPKAKLPELAKSDGRQNKAQARLSTIIDALELYTEDAKLPFNRQAMPGPLGKDWQEEGSFHWFCANLDPAFKRGWSAFRKHRSGICALAQFAKKTNFYRLALPHIAPKFTAATKARKSRKN